jgi:outer membrane immunogenic protein
MKNMKFALLAATFLAGAVSAANAADLGRYEGGSLKDGPVYTLPATWTGLYIGANAGYSWGNSDWSWPAYGTHTSPDFDGGLFGGQIGYNYQMGNLVLGAEVSLSGSNASGDAKCPGAPYVCQTELNWLLIAGPRLGLAVDKTLFYATGGYARGSLHTNVSPAFTGYDQDTTHNGWALGGGIEYQLTPNLILGAEYMHVDLSSEHINNPIADEAHNVDANMDIVRARLNYKFGGRESMK